MTQSHRRSDRSFSVTRAVVRGLGWVLAAALVLAVVAAGFGVWTVQRSFPQTSGELTIDGLEHPVSVTRDTAGIPVITAQSAHDLFLAQGFVHAQDRFWEMDFRRHMTAGRLSELFGESQVGTDAFLRTLGWHDIAEREVAALPAEAKGYFDAYAAGVNAYIADKDHAELSLEYAVLGLQNDSYEVEPWTPTDSVAWLKAMAWDLRTNIEDETARALLAQDLSPAMLAELYPGYDFENHPVIVTPAELAAEGVTGPGTAHTAAGGGALTDDGMLATIAAELAGDLGSTLENVDTLVSAQGEGVGSNSWVVSGDHTDTGLPLLANDPHLGASLPSVWTQMHLRCETVSDDCDFNVAGFSFSGLPGIVIGHNTEVAWGFTNLTTDVADLYVERVDGDHYWKDGEKLPLTVREETLRVAGGDDVPLTVRETGHGPIVSGLTSDFSAIAEDPLPAVTTELADSDSVVAEAQRLPGEFALSLRWTALDEGHTAAAIFDLNRAHNWDSFRAAASQFDVPAQNLIYADTSGNIGYQAPGALPIRGKGDGYVPQPGWDSAYDWQGYIPFDDQPRVFNPEKGYISTANAAIVDDSYPYFLSRDWDYGYRAKRIEYLLESLIAQGPVTTADMQRLQMDQLSPFVTPLKKGFANIRTGEPKVDEALELLRDWDGQNTKGSAGAAFANSLFKQTVTLMVADKSEHVSLGNHSRYASFVTEQLDSPNSAWWKNTEAGVDSQEELLVEAAKRAYAETRQLLGRNPSQWRWGDMHAITLTHDSFGKSGIAPIEALFNRGPYPVGGGSGVVDATGFDMDSDSFTTTTVPSFRMVADLSDWDASTWIHLTGASGHAFHRHYTSQTEDWSNGVQRNWNFSDIAVSNAAKDSLTLNPQ